MGVQEGAQRTEGVSPPRHARLRILSGSAIRTHKRLEDALHAGVFLVSYGSIVL